LSSSNSGITDYTAKSISVNRVVAGYSNNAPSIGHNYMFSLSGNAKPGLLKCTDGIEMIYTRYLSQFRLPRLREFLYS
jgi:hypothetical protein